MSDLRRVRGNAIAWGSIYVTVQGERYYGFTEISYDDSLDRPVLYGLHGPRGKPRGKYTCSTAKLKGPKSSINELRKQLAKGSVDGKSYGTTDFNVVAQFIEQNSNEEPMLVELMQCSVVKDASSASEGAEALTDEIEVQPLYIKRNGMMICDNSDGMF